MSKDTFSQAWVWLWFYLRNQANLQCGYNVVTTSLQRRDVVTTLMRRFVFAGNALQTLIDHVCLAEMVWRLSKTGKSRTYRSTSVSDIEGTFERAGPSSNLLYSYKN